ncbi:MULTISPECIES: restriction endonuclease [Robertmurraya]|uniref:DEAD/DEAH box helicase family protein n=1 Tax=Robertmurraya beringensis TaxID=641660 RepID=A0ABV6KUQ5_9BACI
MKIQFEANQDYQLDAIKSVVEVFNGQPLAKGQYEVDLTGMVGGFLSELGTGNQLLLEDWQILKNVQAIQEENKISPIDELKGMHFSIDMETGTGKTYVYLRTIHELHQKYGFTKFIIVVPSVAIREGVLKNLEITQDHFQTIFGKQPLDYWVYDSSRVSLLRQFASSKELQIMVINIDAFNKKDNNIIHKENDKLSGRKPIEFIQATNPILIIDEPQNMESKQAKDAIQSLNPLCTLRYSATHRKLYNQLYRLGPVQAYDMKLVKKIEVDSVLDDPDFNQPFIAVESIKATKTKITAKVKMDIQEKNGPKRKSISISKNGTDLYEISNERTMYKGFVVDYIDAGSGYIAFTNGVSLNEGQTIGGQTDELMKVQIYETVKEHLEKELRIRQKRPEGRRLKVLSLFFIDKVSNYTEDDGKIRLWFIDAYEELSFKPRYKDLNLPTVEKVHNGYFATDTKGKAKDTRGNTKADDEAYQLIMKDKERLLSLEEPLRFIFSHSALREGWDNPNVFQICTLNETKSELKKRQEIGRGLRLPVDETGNRIFDDHINRLTIIANENYEDFATSLQTEIEEETGEVFNKERINNKRERKKVNLIPKWRDHTEFVELWERIKYKTRYSVHYDSNDLIVRAATAIRQMPKVEKTKIYTRKASFGITKDGISNKMLAINEASIDYKITNIPDILSYIQKETELTRKTIAVILKKSNRLADIWQNPQQFLDQVTKAIRITMQKMMVEGIKYEKISGDEYEMRLFEENEIEGYISRMVSVEGSIYDALEYDSEVEKKFAEELDQREDIKFFLKLPRWFTVDTPLGKYNPDWAIVRQRVGEEAKLYLVAETKSTLDETKLRESENDKIECGKAHFNVLEEVTFKKVTAAEQV